MSGTIKIIRKVKLDKKLFTVVKIIEQTPKVKRDAKNLSKSFILTNLL